MKQRPGLVVGVVAGSTTLDLVNMWCVFGFGSLRELFGTWVKVMLGSRFVAVSMLRV